MLRLGLLCALATIGAACADGPDTSPLAGNWRVDRTARSATAACPSLTLPPLAMTLRPGFEKEIDLGPRQYGSDNSIAGNHITFTTSEFAFSGTSDMLIIVHDLEIQNGDDHLIGTATAQGDGAHLGCRWDMDAVASRTSR
jgi:hypothetical protein